ncbi:MAG: hypothetical protein HY898_15200 [Deltaproteobacteria bacterium]|nr:hypothetical protein [Deltaproteobacteria bacterium]
MDQTRAEPRCTGQVAGWRIALVVVAVAMGASPACKKEESQFERIVASAKSAEPPPPTPKDFVFPAMSGLSARDLIPTVNRARKESPPGQEGKIDEWLQGFKFPVEPIGPTKKFASDIGSVLCHFRDKTLQCAIQAKIPEKHKFFVTSSLTCLNAKGEVVKKVDWESPAKSKRGELTELPVDEAFLTPCFAEGGAKIAVELLGSPCAVPFPHQVRCAGEYATCMQTIQGVEGGAQRCENNRLHCLDVCKK